MTRMTVRSAEDMAKLLRDADPEEAAAFARTEHEKACSGWHEGRVAFWRKVVDVLAGPDAA